MIRLTNFLIVLSILIAIKLQGQTITYSNKVEKDIFQIELYSDQTVQHQDLEKLVYWSLPSILFRYGLSERIELQVVTPFTLKQIYGNSNIHTNHYMSMTQVGVLVNLLKQHKSIPEISFTYRSIIPFEENTIAKTSHLFSLNLSNKIFKHFNLNYNLKYKILPESEDVKSAIVNLGYDVTNKLQFFVETSAEIMQQSIISNFIIGGLSYTLMKNLYINIYYGNCLKQNTSLAGGILTWRLNTKHSIFKNKFF